MSIMRSEVKKSGQVLLIPIQSVPGRVSESTDQLLSFSERVRFVKGPVYSKLQECHSKARRAHKGFTIVSYAKHEILTYRS